MTVDLSPESEQRVKQMIQSGRFASADAAVETAVGMLADDDLFRVYAPGELDALIEEGVADIDAGRSFSIDEVKAHLAGVLAAERHDRT